MKSALKEIFHEYIDEAKNYECIDELYVRLERNKKYLKSQLTKQEKKLLLRIIDDKDLIKEEICSNSFIEGFKLGLKIGYESNKD